MIFAGEEYDAGASLHASNAPANQLINVHIQRRSGASPLTFSNFENVLNVCKAVEPKIYAYARALDVGGL
jgi:hypothetical protein